MTRVDPLKVDSVIEASKETLQPAATESAAKPGTFVEDLAEEINIDDFMKVDLRIARIISAESIPEADKLLKPTVDIGNETRTIFAGIQSPHDPSHLHVPLTVFVANLQPLTILCGTSALLVLAAASGGYVLYFLYPAFP